jgi:thioredoxin-like negative regulator of GroEL
MARVSGKALVCDVTKTDFDQLVLARSHEVPVVEGFLCGFIDRLVVQHQTLAHAAVAPQPGL